MSVTLALPSFFLTVASSSLSDTVATPWSRSAFFTSSAKLITASRSFMPLATPSSESPCPLTVTVTFTVSSLIRW